MNFLNFSQRYRWIILLVTISIAHFLVDIMLGIWPVYKSMMKLDLATAGLIVACGAFLGEGAQVIFGSLSDKGYRKILVIIGLFAATSSAFLVYSENYILLFIMYLMTCIGSGCFHPAASGMMQQLSPQNRSLLIAFFATGGSLGLAFSQIIFTSTYHFFEGHTYLLALPAILVGGLLLTLSFTSSTTPIIKKQKPSLKETWGFFKNPALRHLYFAQVANQSILWGTIFILPDCLKTLGYSEWIAYGGGHLCFILGGSLMTIPAGYLAQLYSSRQVMLYAGLGGFGLFYFLLFFGSYSLALLLPSLFLLGACLFIVNPLGISLGMSLEPNHPGAISAFLMGLVWCVSESLGPGGVGLLTTFFEDYVAVKALAVLGSLFIVQIYTTSCLPQDNPQLASDAEAQESLI